MSEAMGRRPVYAGIDVSKAVLDVAVQPGGQTWRATNDEAGIGGLVARLRGVGPVLVVLEATGGMEVALAGALAVAGLPVAVVNPRQVRDVARSTPGPPDGWPRRTASMRRSSPTSPSGSAPTRAPCPMRPRGRWRRW